MDIKRILLVVLAVLLLIVAWTMIFGGHDGNSPSLAPKGDVSMAVTGDVMFARNMAGVLSTDVSPFEGVSNVTSNVDLLLINFENAATTSENAVKGDVPLKCDPSYVPLAKANNNTVAALANNHVFDYGIDGMRDTSNNLKKAGITTVGAGENQQEAGQAVVKEINGRKITILNYMDANNFAEYGDEIIPSAKASSPGYSAYNTDSAKNEIQKHNDSDLIVAFMHYGNEYTKEPNEDQKRISHELIDNGADVVIGAHPHVVQGIEMYNGKPIFYSLGDFIFDISGGDLDNAYMVKLNIVGDKCECNVYPVYLSNFLPHLMDADSGRTLIESLTPLCSELQIDGNGVGKLTFDLSN